MIRSSVIRLESVRSDRAQTKECAHPVGDDIDIVDALARSLVQAMAPMLEMPANPELVKLLDELIDQGTIADGQRR